MPSPFLKSPGTKPPLVDPTVVVGESRAAIRLRKALETGIWSSADIAVLLRQYLRERDVQGGGRTSARVAKGDHSLDNAIAEKCGLAILGESADSFVVSANPWIPTWDVAEELEARLYSDQLVRQQQRVAGDPFLKDITKGQHDQYASAAQRTAVHAALLAPPASTLVVNLPTGGGKSLVGILPALLASRRSRSLALVVVPTVALALDQAKAIEPWVGHHCAYVGGVTAEDERQRIRRRINDGVQRILFTSPEAAMGSLRSAIEHSAEQGYLNYLIIDEAHIVEAWGHGFRPHFQQLSGFRRGLLERCPDHQHRFRTLLMSATFTPGTMATLRALYSDPGPFEVVSSVKIRPELMTWQVRCRDFYQEAQPGILESIWHLPRPLILYTTEVKHANLWRQRLLEEGFRRVGLFTGETNERDRRALIDSWQADQIDVMVATSAFGMGIDKQDVRTVIHSCVPESLDRYYQEIGRAARDGKNGAALMFFTERDWETAQSMASQGVLDPEKAWDRLQALIRTRYEDSQGAVLKLNAATRPDYNPLMSERGAAEWNDHLLNLLARLRLIRFAWDPSEKVEDQLPATAAKMLRIIEILSEDVFHESPFKDQIAEERARESEEARAARERFYGVLEGRRCLGEALAELYGLSDDAHEIPVGASCGGCNFCRQRRRLAWQDPAPIPKPAWRDRISSVQGHLATVVRSGEYPLLVPVPAAKERALHLALLPVLPHLLRIGLRQLVVPDHWREEVWRELKIQDGPPVVFAETSNYLRLFHVPTLFILTADFPAADQVLRPRPFPQIVACSESMSDPELPHRLLGDCYPGLKEPFTSFKVRLQG